MTAPPIIGLTGKLGSGKDTVLERIQTLYPGAPDLDSDFRQASFAATLKNMACALFDITREQLEKLKRRPNVEISVVDHDEFIDMDTPRSYAQMDFRTFLQRLGTEAGRDILGENFWVDQAFVKIDYWEERFSPRMTHVFTDVRFENEAQAIIDRGGEIWLIEGPDEDTGSHASEQGLPDWMINVVIVNTARDDDFRALDQQIRGILG